MKPAPVPAHAATHPLASSTGNTKSPTVNPPTVAGATPSTTPAVRAASAPAAASPASSAPRPVAAATLDLGALEQRLRDTRSIGLFAKLSLKNQVDDLLGSVRSYYQAQGKPPPTSLRQNYDGLLLKVIAMLQDGDPALASAILTSREAIWGILADPVKLSRT
jgi:hypothetical protein